MMISETEQSSSRYGLSAFTKPSLSRVRQRLLGINYYGLGPVLPQTIEKRREAEVELK